MRDLFEYNKKCNELLVFAMLDAGFAHKRVTEEISHILNVHYMWVAKMAGERYNKNLWNAIAVNDLFKANNLVHEKTEALLAGDVHKKVLIKVDENDVEKPIATILHEILFYSAGHRSKVEVLFNKFEVPVPKSNYINFKKLDLVDNF